MADKKKRWSDNRGNSNERGYDGEWRKVRAAKVKASPFCERCLKAGKHVPIKIKANGNYGVVHHIKPVDQFPALRLTMDNLESLCFECHEAEHGRMVISGCDESGMPLNSDHFWNK